MSCLLAYLAGLLYYGSSLTFATCPSPYALLNSIDVAECGLHPSLEGRGQVNLGVERPKKNERV